MVVRWYLIVIRNPLVWQKYDTGVQQFVNKNLKQNLLTSSPLWKSSILPAN